MKGTLIQWCDDTVDPTTGCDGCELWIPGRGGPCYAGNLHESRLSKSLPSSYDANFNNVRLAQGRMAKIARCANMLGMERQAKPWLNGRRRLIFVGDLGDVFSAAVPFEFLRSEITNVATSREGSRHDWLLLTKQPRRAAHFANWLLSNGGAWPTNLWVGTSITGRASISRIRHLAMVPALVRFLSLEPLWDDPGLDIATLADAVHWVIIGGESEQGNHEVHPFDLAWVRSLIALCEKAHIPVFVKQLGSRPIDGGNTIQLRDRHGGDWSEWPKELAVRQMPA